MTYKNAKTILFAGLIAAMILPFSGMLMAEAAPNENANDKVKGKLFIKESRTEESSDRKEMNRLLKLLASDDLTEKEIKNIKEKREILKEKTKKITPVLSTEKRIEIRGHIDAVGDVMMSLKHDNIVPIVSVGTDAENQAVKVRILKEGLTDEKILQYEKILRKIIGNDVNLTIIPSGPATYLTCVTQTGDCNPLEGGGKITMQNATGYCSMGFKASYDSKTGFITAGHCNSGDIGGTGEDVGQPLAIIGDKIGVVHANAFADGGWCDCIFVDASETISDKVFSGIDVNGTLFPVLDDYILAEGANTQGEGGQIDDIYEHFTASLGGNNYQTKGAVMVDFTFSPGDSGGTIYEDVSSGTPKFAGIISANVDGKGYYIPYHRATTAFSGLTFTYD